MAISQKLMDELKRRREEAFAAGGNDKLQARRAKGLLTARDRIEALFDEGTFMEFGMHVQHNCHNFGMERKTLPTDGIVAGIGYVQGRPVAAFSQDFTVAGGSLGSNHAKKIVDLMKFAGKNGMPVIGINDSGGARIQEGVESLAGYGQIFYQNVSISGVVPQISIIAGPCAGGAAYSPALMDFIIMTRKNANLFICGPQVIKAATGEEASVEMFATADAHATVSGNIHLVAEDDREAIAIAEKLLSYLPSNNMQEPPHDFSVQVEKTYDEELNNIVPASAQEALDVYKVIERVADAGSFFEIQRNFARNIVVGFARIQGIVVGIIANQPAYKAGCLDIDASDKAARFIRTCNAFNVPIVNMVDVPGFMPGLAQERGGIIRHGAKMLFAYASATVPKITLIMRKAYGGAYLAMCCVDMGADAVFAWPTAEIAVMGAKGAVNVLYGKEIKAAENPGELAAKYQQEYADKFSNPYQAASKGMITDVIEPAQTRGVIAMALRATLGKRETRLPKRHGNIPL
ncbi:MAG: methylmalonyl-CoA carboxyltransferase [Verrucomicrobia bacterium]|nr:MAG: methylmalonyl-CoA carboxyltransferase [Verrucomicrobiota bacterium]